MTTPEVMLEQTSRTFAIPIRHLPSALRRATTSAYLSCRAIDEIEDHEALIPSEKAPLLLAIASSLEEQVDREGEVTLPPFPRGVPEVTARLGEWVAHAPLDIRPRIIESVATMATRMAAWTITGWSVQTQADLDRYTHAVAGAVGLLLADLWTWDARTEIPRTGAANLGRGLQTVNIIVNRAADLERGVDFYPRGWADHDMFAYASQHLKSGWQFIGALPSRIHRQFCTFPTILAELVLAGQPLSRPQVKYLERAVYSDHVGTRAALLGLFR